MRLRTSEVNKLREMWGNKPCDHSQGYGHEISDDTGCDCDCFCVTCGLRFNNPDFFIKRMKPKNQ